MSPQSRGTFVATFGPVQTTGEKEASLNLDPIDDGIGDFQKCPKVVQAPMLVPSVSTLIPTDKHCSVS